MIAKQEEVAKGLVEIIPTLKAEEILPRFLRQFVVLIDNPKLMEPHYEVRTA
jgi:hypothetical protein